MPKKADEVGYFNPPEGAYKKFKVMARSLTRPQVRKIT
jgi:hypothetical protein